MIRQPREFRIELSLLESGLATDHLYRLLPARFHVVQDKRLLVSPGLKRATRQVPALCTLSGGTFPALVVELSLHIATLT